MDDALSNVDSLYELVSVVDAADAIAAQLASTLTVTAAAYCLTTTDAVSFLASGAEREITSIAIDDHSAADAGRLLAPIAKLHLAACKTDKLLAYLAQIKLPTFAAISLCASIAGEQVVVAVLMTPPTTARTHLELAILIPAASVQALTLAITRCAAELLTSKAQTCPIRAARRLWFSQHTAFVDRALGHGERVESNGRRLWGHPLWAWFDILKVLGEERLPEVVMRCDTVTCVAGCGEVRQIATHEEGEDAALRVDGQN